MGVSKVIDNEEDLSQFGFEPGWYTAGTCRTCGNPYIGSKYTYNCKDCALEKKNAEKPFEQMELE